MFDSLRRRLTYANVMSTVAVFLAIGGGAYAAVKLPRNSVGKSQIKNGAVTHRKLARRAINHLKYLCRRGLLFQGLSRFGNEPRIFHRDHRLRGKVLQ